MILQHHHADHLVLDYALEDAETHVPVRAPLHALAHALVDAKIHAQERVHPLVKRVAPTHVTPIALKNVEDNVPDAQIRVRVHVRYHAINFAFPAVKVVVPVDAVGRVEPRVIATAVIIHALLDVVIIVLGHAPRTALPNVVIIVKRIARVYVLARARVHVKMDVLQHAQVHAALPVPVGHLAIVNISQ